jgi:hydroxymethylbilane synthase
MYPALAIRIIPIRTGGDDLTHPPVGPLGVKGLFTKEIEEALLSREVDMAIHSAKDLPGILPEGLVLGAVPERASPFDAFLGVGGISFDSLPEGARVGTSSLRRRSQLLSIRPDLKILPLRGNVDTRVAKLNSGECDAVILAAAGLQRLEREDVRFVRLDPKILLPAPGQGTLALEHRMYDERVSEILKPLNHQISELTLIAERSFMATLGTGCQVPAAAWARITGNELLMDALVAEVDGSQIIRTSGAVKNPGKQNAMELGKMLARNILDKGGDGILVRARVLNQETL